jgi:hypothetical protein
MWRLSLPAAAAVAGGVASGVYIFNAPLRQLSEDVRRTADERRARYPPRPAAPAVAVLTRTLL